jgi:hypothetical protein
MSFPSLSNLIMIFIHIKKRGGSSIDLQAQASGNKGENEGEFLYEKQSK